MTRWLVVGGGAAGCVVAARLSEDAGNDVTLLEAGPDHGAPAGAPGEPLTTDPARLRPAVNVIRRPGEAPKSYLQGFGLGGSSIVNAGVVVGDATAAALGHDLPIEPVADIGPVADAVLRTAAGARRVALVARGGRRVTAAGAYVEPARRRPNLTVSAGTRVERVEMDGRRAVGVVTASGDHVEADRVVMCAGAIETPAILLRSGVDAPGIGQGLADHVGFTVTLELVRPAPVVVPAIGVTVERPGREIVVMDRLPGAPEFGALIAGHLAVTSAGRVSLPDPAGPPRVELAQLSGSSDLDGLQFVAREALDLVDTPELRAVVGAAYIDDHGTPAARLRDPASLRAWIPEHLGGYHHLAGSCRVGICLGDDGGVLDHERLFVADASALPGPPPRNVYLTVVRHAERFASRHLERAD